MVFWEVSWSFAGCLSGSSHGVLLVSVVVSRV